MRYLLFILLVVGLAITSCSIPDRRQPIKTPSTTYARAVNVDTGVMCIISIPDSLYRSGDTIWVSTATMKPVNVTWDMNDKVARDNGFILCALE